VVLPAKCTTVVLLELELALMVEMAIMDPQQPQITLLLAPAAVVVTP
jgi:hypothetical protein